MHGHKSIIELMEWCEYPRFCWLLLSGVTTDLPLNVRYGLTPIITKLTVPHSDLSYRRDIKQNLNNMINSRSMIKYEVVERFNLKINFTFI